MRRPLLVLATSLLTLALLAPVALAQSSGQGTIGEATDKRVTNAGFILIAFFPLFIFTMSIIQWRLEKRKNRRKAAAKARAGSSVWKGGW